MDDDAYWRMFHAYVRRRASAKALLIVGPVTMVFLVLGVFFPTVTYSPGDVRGQLEWRLFVGGAFLAFDLALFVYATRWLLADRRGEKRPRRQDVPTRRLTVPEARGAFPAWTPTDRPFDTVGHPVALDTAAESADSRLPAFLAPPPGAPVYHGFPVLDGVEAEGWRLGLITSSLDTLDHTGDAYVIAPDGQRAGLVWRVEQPSWSIQLSGPEPDRLAVFEVATAHGPTSIDDARRFIVEVLPPIVAVWEQSRNHQD